MNIDQIKTVEYKNKLLKIDLNKEFRSEHALN